MMFTVRLCVTLIAVVLASVGLPHAENLAEVPLQGLKNTFLTSSHLLNRPVDVIGLLRHSG